MKARAGAPRTVARCLTAYEPGGLGRGANGNRQPLRGSSLADWQTPQAQRLRPFERCFVFFLIRQVRRRYGHAAKKELSVRFL